MPINEVLENKYLNEWELEKFRDFEAKAEYGRRYRIDPDRPDCKEYILMLKKRHYIYKDVYIHGDWIKFERVFVPEYEAQDYLDYWSRRLTAHYKENPPGAEQSLYYTAIIKQEKKKK